MSPRAEIVVDLAAFRHNIASLAELVAPARLLVVLKADAYGHGLLECGRAAREAGAGWLGVATLDEAMALRTAGDTGRLFAWLTVPGEDLASALDADIDLAAYGVDQLDEIALTGRRARVHLKVDTGMGRGGAAEPDWAAFFARAGELAREHKIEVAGIWSHFAAADAPVDPLNDAQENSFRRALALAGDHGIEPETRHLANSAASILRPSSRFDLVRCGLATYGLDPAPGHLPADLDLRPVMSVRTSLVMRKTIPAGGGVSYGHTWTAPRETPVGLVPLGYGDGIPRHGSSRAEVMVAGARVRVLGRICMDQFVVDLTGVAAERGAQVTIFGNGTAGEPTAQDWAEACDTISYEIVTRTGGRLVRRQTDSGATTGGDDEWV